MLTYAPFYLIGSIDYHCDPISQNLASCNYLSLLTPFLVAATGTFHSQSKSRSIAESISIAFSQSE